MSPDAVEIERWRPLSSRRGAAVTVAGALLFGGAMAVTTGSASAATRPHAKKVPLVIYSAQGYAPAEIKAFEHQTGIKVKFDNNSTGPLLNQIEASKNNPNWGLLWVDGPTAFAALDQQHLLLRGFEPKVAWTGLGRKNIPRDQSYIPTGLTLMAAVVYDSKVVKHPPTSWRGLLNKRWDNAIGMDDPSQSGPTYPYVAGMMKYLGGEQAGKRYFETLKKHGLVINPTNGPTLQALTSGQIKLAIVQSSAGIGAKLGDPSLRVEYLSPVTQLASCIGIDRKVSKTEQKEAERFADFVLSKRGQKVMQSGDPTGDSLFYPVLQHEKPLRAVPSIHSVRTQYINPYLWGRKEAAINRWFENNIVQ